LHKDKNDNLNSQSNDWLIPLPYEKYHGVFNPSIVQGENGLWGVARADIYPKNVLRSDRDKRFENEYLVFELSEKMELTGCKRLSWIGFPAKFKAIDIRLFRYQKKFYGTFQLTSPIDSRLSGHHLAEINFHNSSIRYIGKFKIRGLIQLPVEKNWGFFNHNEEIYCIYSICPIFIVTRVVSLEKATMEVVLKADLTRLYQFLDPLAFVSVSSAPFQTEANRLLLTFHQHSSYCDYKHYALWLDSESLTPISVTRSAFFSLPGNYHWKPGMVVVNSAIYREGKIILFYGKSDQTSRIRTFEYKYLAKTSLVLNSPPKTGIETARDLGRALSLFKSNDLDEAFKLINTAIDKLPESILGNFLAALYWARKRNVNLSIDFFRKISPNTTENVYILFHLARILDTSGNFLGAEKTYKLAIETDPNYVDPLLALGMLYFRFNEFIKAVGIFELAWKLKPRLGTLCEKIAQCYLKINQPQSAQQTCIKGIESGGNKEKLELLLRSAKTMTNEVN